MRIIVKKANISKEDLEKGQYYITDAMWWRKNALDLELLGFTASAARSIDIYNKSLKFAARYLGFSSVEDLRIWYAKHHGIGL